MKLPTSPLLWIIAVLAALSITNCQIPGSTFDSRTYWHQCTVISEISDRGDCDSSWAFAAVETMSDRTCIRSGSKGNIRLSVDDVLSCCGSTCGATSRCSGGNPAGPWNYWVQEGIVSEECKPYNLSEAPSCERTCREGHPVSYEEDKSFGRSVFQLPNDTTLIQLEIMRNGPVATTIRVSDDFANYRGGIYRPTSNVAVRYESARIIGWASQAGYPYWLLANSRGYDWGDKGIFLIERERDEGGVESSVRAGTPYN